MRKIVEGRLVCLRALAERYAARTFATRPFVSKIEIKPSRVTARTGRYCSKPPRTVVPSRRTQTTKFDPLFLPLVPIIDDAHLMASDGLRKLRLLFEDFPRSHNLVLLAQPPLLQTLALTQNEEIRSRVTYSVMLPRLAPEMIEAFILGEMDRIGLGHHTVTPDALALVVRSGEGLLRRTKNLFVSSLIEAVRDQTRTVDLKQVNRVLMQPHWRRELDVA